MNKRTDTIRTPDSQGFRAALSRSPVREICEIPPGFNMNDSFRMGKRAGDVYLNRTNSNNLKTTMSVDENIYSDNKSNKKERLNRSYDGATYKLNTSSSRFGHSPVRRTEVPLSPDKIDRQ